ncbi:hypothetical protein AGRA3207_003647 [Actinomadura graeca]|uniref:Transposase n=1 Tax=Actinomadura graeca TaxID=2750812 RepID=A0ABX8QW86_9ACTN|nr:hypothetical protein [Actinomadura graeca]QXJ22616.1 hypothetical protein AGRA3207_003647 [Actinomadura graeca]
MVGVRGSAGDRVNRGRLGPKDLYGWQAAQGARDTGLPRVVERCHPDTLRQMRWANAHLKQISAQVLNS